MDATSSPAPPTWGACLTWAETLLARAGSPSPPLDALVLLIHATHTAQTHLLAEPQHPMAPARSERYAAWVARRAAGEPVAYITGHKAFMGLDLLVDRRVLLVRPSTRWLVEAALEHMRTRPVEEGTTDEAGLLVADIGTGCGAIALALAALEPRVSRIYAVDISAGALEVARANGARYRQNALINWLEGDTLEPVPEPVDLIVANLPYLRDVPSEAASETLRFEPRLALFSNPDGLDHIRKLLAQAPEKLRPGGTLAFALDDSQRPAAAQLLAAALPQAYVAFGPSTVGGDHFAIAQLPASPGVEEQPE